MTDIRQLLDDYAAQAYDADEYAGFYIDPQGIEVYGVARRNAAPKAFAALRAVLDEHEWVNIGGTYGKWCKTCTSDAADSAAPAAWPCPTVRAITTALEAK